MDYKRKKYHLDALRVLASFFVLFGHSDLRGQHYFMTTTVWNPSYWASICLQQFTFVNIAIFFMISGALLLKKEEDLKTLFKKRILKYVLLIIVFGFFQCIYDCTIRYPEQNFNLIEILKKIYSTSVIYQYWFLRSYLAFLIILPFLRILVKNMSDKLMYYLLGGYVIVFAILPPLEILLGLDRIQLHVTFYTDLVILPLTGHFLENNFFPKVKWTKPRILLSNVIMLAAWGVNVWYTFKRMEQGLFYYVADGLTYLLMVGLYIDFRLICDKIKEKRLAKGKEKASIPGNIISFLAGGSLMILLFEPQLRENTMFIYDNLVDKIKWLPADVVWLGTALIIAACINFVKDLFLKTVKKIRQK